MVQSVGDHLKNLNQNNLKLAKKENKTALNVELVGIKNLKMTHNWRIEFDVFEMDNDKVKDLMDMLNKPISMGLVQLDE
jgi:glucan biosynthesis protein